MKATIYHSKTSEMQYICPSLGKYTSTRDAGTAQICAAPRLYTRHSIPPHSKLPRYHEPAQRASYPYSVSARSPACSWPCLVLAAVPSALPPASAPATRSSVAARTGLLTPRRYSEGCTGLKTSSGNRTTCNSPPAMDRVTTEVPHRAFCSGICCAGWMHKHGACAEAAHTCAACIACSCS